MNETAYPSIEAFGIKLQRLGREDIELVRNWRNNPSVRHWMEFTEDITISMQETWYDSLDLQIQFYYLIEYEGTPIGLVNLKNSNGVTAEGGIFIADESHQNRIVGFKAILGLYDFGFKELGLKEITANILKSNTRAIRFNQALGFQKDSHPENVKNQSWRLSFQNYFTYAAPIRIYLANKIS